MTVGASLLVNSCSLTNLMARSARLFNAAGADSSCIDESFSNFSKYIRIVAPALPVPLSRKTTRAESPVGYWQFRINPCFEETDPSTGSTYL